MPLMEQNHKRHICFYYTPSFVHQFSIDPPSKRWTIDGVSMEHLRSIYGGIREKQRSFLRGRAFVHRVKNQERRKIKIPYRQGIHEELMEVWERESYRNNINTFLFLFPKIYWTISFWKKFQKNNFNCITYSFFVLYFYQRVAFI